MSQQKTLGRGGGGGGGGGAASGDGHEDLPLQAVLLADRFTHKFRPITLERPKVLLPLVHMPMIEYTLRWLESAGVEEAFVVCCAHSHQVKDYLDRAGWAAGKSRMAVTVVESHDAISAGDALRVIYDRGVIHGDFLLISGDTVSNMSLKDALQEHMDRKKKEPLAVMTMVIKHSKPSVLRLQTRLGDDGFLMMINPETKELLYYKDRADNSHLYDKDILTNNPTLQLHNDMEDCYIDICSPEVLCLFTDNFDYQHLRRHFVKGLLVDDIMGYKIYTHELRSGYAAKIDNFSSYATVSKDVISQRWTYPMVPDVISSPFISKKVISNPECPESRLHRQRTYMASDVTLSPSAQVVGNSVVGSATSIGDHCRVLNSFIGEGCQIGKYVWINDSFIWDNVIIEDGCKVKDSLVCDGVHLRAGAVVEPGCVLSFKVEVGKNVVVPAQSKVSLLPQPSNEDSDEELEYADINSGITDTLAFSSMWSTGDQTTVPLEEDEVGTSEAGTCGVVGYIWTSVDTGIVGVRTQPVAHDSSHNVVEDADRISKFEKKVEELFRQALGGDVTPDNLILKIDGLRLAYSPQRADCAGAVFYSIMKSALVAAQSTYGSVLVPTLDTLDKWQEVLRNYTKTIDDEMEILLKFGVLYQETKKGFSRVFPEVLACLYDMWLVSGGGILRWAEEKERGDKSYKFVVEQSKNFIQWLKKPLPDQELVEE